MTSCNSEGIAEFIRLVGELEDLVESMSDYEKKFMYDNIDRIEKYGDKVTVSEAQLEFIRRVYKRIL